MKVDLTWIDYLIMMIYFVFVLGIGWFLRKFMKNANAFLEAGRAMPAWVAGLAFIATNLGAIEVMGMTGSSMKYGMLTTHFYLIGAIPAMIFLALFMMPFYYGSKARSVPEFLKNTAPIIFAPWDSSIKYRSGSSAKATTLVLNSGPSWLKWLWIKS